MKDVGNRIRLLRKELKLSQKEFAKRLDIGLTTLKDYEKGNFLPKTEVILRLRNIFNINPTWLLTGEGDMFLAKIENFQNPPNPTSPSKERENIIANGTVAIGKIENIKIHTTDIESLKKALIELLETIRKKDKKDYEKAIKKLTKDLEEIEEIFLR